MACHARYRSGCVGTRQASVVERHPSITGAAFEYLFASGHRVHRTVDRCKGCTVQKAPCRDCVNGCRCRTFGRRLSPMPPNTGANQAIPVKASELLAPGKCQVLRPLYHVHRWSIRNRRGCAQHASVTVGGLRRRHDDLTTAAINAEFDQHPEHR